LGFNSVNKLRIDYVFILSRQRCGHLLPFLIVSGAIGEDLAVEAMRNGADDYLIKGRLARLGPALTNALRAARTRRCARARWL
jgi:FixJ family two-component response regulator